MSRTYRKYPSGHYRSNSVNYSDWKDIPLKPWYYKKYKIQIDYIKEWVLLGRFNKENDYIGSYTCPKLMITPVRRRVETNEWYLGETQCDYAYVYDYNKKSSENQRCRCLGVGKEWKRLRKKHHREEARQAIHQWRKGNFDAEIPIEKNHDRWDYW